MSNDRTPGSERSTIAPPRERGQIIVIYALFGPLAGLFIQVAGIFTANALSSNLAPLPADMAGAVAGFFAIAAIATYVIGGLQALATGLVLYAVADKDGGFAYWQAAIVAALVGAAAAPVIILMFNGKAETAFMLGVIGVLSSLLLRVFWRKKFRRRHA